MYQLGFDVYTTLALFQMNNHIDTSSLISAISAFAAIASALYAYLQVRQAKESNKQAQKTILEAFTQNRINALIVLKDHFENELPKIKKLADHFSAPETYESAGKPLHDEHEELRKKLQKVKIEIEKFYESYVLAKSTSKNG